MHGGRADFTGLKILQKLICKLCKILQDFGKFLSGSFSAVSKRNLQENMRLDSLVFELYAWGGRETVAELRWRLQRRGHRVEVKVAKQGLQSLGGGCKPGVAEL